MITYELLTKLRLENASLLTRVERLRARAEAESSAAFARELGMMQSELRDYVGLVDAVIDALMPDTPNTRERSP